MKTGKLVSIVLTLAMLLSVLPMSAMAYDTNGETAKVSVAFKHNENDEIPFATITATTYSNNSLKINIPDNIPKNADTAGWVVVSANRFLGPTNDGVDSLNYSQGYNSNVEYNTIRTALKDLTGLEGPYTVNVSVIDGSTQESAVYSLKKEIDGAISATPGDNGIGASQDVWEALSDGSRIAVTTKSDNDSKIILPAGSAIYLKSKDLTGQEKTGYNHESIIVKDGNKLTLDNFNDLDSMATEIASHTTYSGEYDTKNPNTDAYKLILKAGTTIAVKTRVITILKDLTITLNGGNGGEDFFEAITTPLGIGLDGLYHSFVDETSGEALDSVDGTGAAMAAAHIVDAIFAGLAAGTEDKELIFTFDTPTASSDAIVSYSKGEEATYTVEEANSAVTSADQGDVLVVNAGNVTIGDTTSEATNKISVAANSTITVESDATATSANNETTVKAAEITITNSTSSGTQKAVVVSATTGSNTKSAALLDTLFTKDESVKQKAGETENETKFSDFVQPAAVVANAVAKNSTIDVSEITKVELTLASRSQDDYVPADVKNLVANDKTNPETSATVNSAAVVEVHPEVTIKRSGAADVTYEVENGQLVDDATFLYTIEGLNGGQYYNVYHVHGDNSVELVDDEVKADGSGVGSGTITVALDSFSYLVSVPTSGGAVSSTEEVKIGTLQGEFGTVYQMKINFRYLVGGVNYGAEIPEGYQLKVWLEDGNSDGSDRLLPLMTDSDYNSEMEWTCYKLSYKDDTNLGRIYTVTAKIFTKNLDKPISIELINNAAGNVTVRGVNLSGSEAVGTNVGYSILDYLEKLMEKSGNTTAEYNAYHELRMALNSACTTLRTAETLSKS